MKYEEAYDKLSKYGQLHVLSFYDQLTDIEKEELLTQIDGIDFTLLEHCHEKSGGEKRNITPLAAMQTEEIEQKKEQFFKTGLEALEQGKVAAVLLAGGMGTRLGSSDPKGMYDIGITRPVFIFQRMIENLMDVVRMSGCFVPLYIMTSDKNHAATVEFFEKHQYFGYDRSYLTFFMQDMAPACDFRGKVFMEEKGKISTSPNGNAGWYGSMDKCGLLEDVQRRGVEWINVFAVDNVLQRIADPCFVGAVIQSGCASGAKVVKKNAPDERVGVMCLEDNKPSIIEYYELTDELMEAKDERGEPAYQFGVILNYLFREADLKKMMNSKFPVHVARKKIEYIDAGGKQVIPEEPNGCKFETLVLDMVHEIGSCLPFEVVRGREFAPIKNKTGIDSVETARQLCMENGIEI